MPNVAGLTILLGADFTSAEQAMDRFNGKVSQFVNQMQSLFASAGVNVNAFNSSFQNFERTSSNVTSSINSTSSATNTLNTNTQRLGGGFNQLSMTATRTFHGLAELMVRPNQALLILSNDIPQLITRLREAQKEGESFGAAFINAIDPAVLAIQLGLTAIIRYGPELYKWVTGANAAKEAAKQAAAEQKELNSAFESGVKSTAESINKVQVLTAEMNDNNSSASQRVDKYNQLIALYPQLAGAMQKEAEQNDKVKGQYDALNINTDNYKSKISQLSDVINNELIPALRNQAIAQGFAAQVTKISEQVSLLIAQSDKLKSSAVTDKINSDKALAPYQGLIDAAKNNPTNERLQNSVTQLFQGKLGDIVSQSEKSTKAYVDNQVAIKKLTLQTDDYIKNQLKYQDEVDKSILGGQTYKEQLEGQRKAAQAVLDNLKAGTPEFEKQKNAVQKLTDELKAYDITSTKVSHAKTQQDKLQDILKSMNVSISDTDLDLSKKLINPDQADKRITEAINSAIAKVQQLNIPDKDTIIAKLMRQYPIQKVDLSAFKGQKDYYDDLIGDQQKLKEGWEKYSNSIFVTMTKIGNKNLSNYFKDDKKQLDELNSQFQDTISKWDSIIGQPIKTFYDDLLHGKNVFKDLEKSFIEMIANMAAKATEAEIISLIMGDKYDGKTGDKSTYGSIFTQLLGGRWGKNTNPIKSVESDNYAPSVSDYGQQNYNKSKATGDAAMKQIQGMNVDASVLSDATINNTNNIIGGVQNGSSALSGTLGGLGAIASLIPGWGTAAGLGLGVLSKAIPFLADGGVVTSPTVAMIGEAGKEAVIPLDKLNQFTGNAQNLNVRVTGQVSGRNLNIVDNNYQTFKAR